MTTPTQHQSDVQPQEPVYWQWRRKDKPWSLEYTFNSEPVITTDDSEKRALFAVPAPSQEPAARLEITLTFAADDGGEESCVIVAHGTERDMQRLKTRIGYWGSLERAAPSDELFSGAVRDLEACSRAIAALRPAPQDGSKAPAAPTEQQIIEAAEAAGLLPNTIRNWMLPMHRFLALLAAATIPAHEAASQVVQLPVKSYAVDADTSIEQVRQINGPPLWAVRRDGCVLAADGQWEYELLPSSRDDAFIARCRYPTPEAALAQLRKVAPAQQAEGPQS